MLTLRAGLVLHPCQAGAGQCGELVEAAWSEASLALAAVAHQHPDDQPVRRLGLRHTRPVRETRLEPPARTVTRGRVAANRVQIRAARARPRTVTVPGAV